MRQLTFAKAINDGLRQACELSEQVIILGQVIDYNTPGVFGTTSGLIDQFGPERIHDFPIAESAMTMTAMGAAMSGFRPVLVHQRLDFMIYSLDAIVNWLSLWRFKSNGQATLPVTIRAVVGKGWGQGPQHSKSLHSWFAHLPGLRVALPSTPYDAKGLLLESIFGEEPTIILEHRALFSMVDHVPEIPYRVRFGRAVCRREGQDVTIVAIGFMVPMALRAAEQLAGEGIHAEVIDLRTVSPLDMPTVIQSVRKTRRLIVADPTWHSFGVAAEVISSVSEQVGRSLLANPARVCFPDSHTPMSAPLEEEFYPKDQDIVAMARNLCRRQRHSEAA